MKRKGFALLTLIFIMLVLSVLVVGIVALFFSGATIFVKDYSSDNCPDFLYSDKSTCR